jgi:Putative transposase DNA-binding domain
MKRSTMSTCDARPQVLSETSYRGRDMPAVLRNGWCQGEEGTVPANAYVLVITHEAKYNSNVRLRYSYRLDPARRFTPTSQTCCRCGVKDGPKPLHIRSWQCRGCGAQLDRDINAAVNIATAAGLAVTACGAQVRPGLVPAQRDEAGTHPTSHRDAA